MPKEFFMSEEKKKKVEMVEIKPKKDFRIKFNEHDIKIIKGEKISIPKLFINNLKTEKVIS